MTTATKPNLVKFRQVYADAVEETGLSEDTQNKIRELHWHGPRVSLAEAAELFAEIPSYNDFNRNTIAKLAAEFPDAGIEATPAREGSPAIYLYIPVEIQAAVILFAFNELCLDEMDVVTKFSCLKDGEAELVGEALRIWWD